MHMRVSYGQRQASEKQSVIAPIFPGREVETELVPAAVGKPKVPTRKGIVPHCVPNHPIEFIAKDLNVQFRLTEEDLALRFISQASCRQAPRLLLGSSQV
jgi:hypothetical protein